MHTPGSALPLFSFLSRQPAVSQKFASAQVRVLSAPETREYSPGPARVPAAEAVVRARPVRRGTDQAADCGRGNESCTAASLTRDRVVHSNS